MRTITLRNFITRLLAVLALACAGAMASAQTDSDPPGRVGALTQIEGAVRFSTAGQVEWTDALRNRPITNGDRLRTEAGARAELHLGTAALHMDGATVLEVVGIDQQAVRFAVTEGSVNAGVRELAPGENFEIGTPQLALRAAEPGDWRLDVDTASGLTRVTVHGGAVTLYGASGAAMRLSAGQQMAFAGRELDAVAGVPAPMADAFDAWVAERNRVQDESVAARHVPRDVVGYPELDRYGSWSQDPTYGSVWFPRLTVTGWAPYRYGRWEWIAPWGWTWVDDAPWGFAPFHYGRWAIIGSRWAWVPGPLGPRPAYAPALVAFVGGQGRHLAVGSGPGGGWYPLAPGEVWQPSFRASAVYLRNVNRHVSPVPRHREGETHYFHRRQEAITAVPANDFHRGAPVGQRWVRTEPSDLPRAAPSAPPTPAAPSSGPGARPGNDRARPGLRIVTPSQTGSSPQPQPTQQPRESPRTGLDEQPRQPARAREERGAQPPQERNEEGGRGRWHGR